MNNVSSNSSHYVIMYTHKLELASENDIVQQTLAVMTAAATTGWQEIFVTAMKTVTNQPVRLKKDV